MMRKFGCTWGVVMVSMTLMGLPASEAREWNSPDVWTDAGGEHGGAVVRLHSWRHSVRRHGVGPRHRRWSCRRHSHGHHVHHRPLRRTIIFDRGPWAGW